MEQGQKRNITDHNYYITSAIIICALRDGSRCLHYHRISVNMLSGLKQERLFTDRGFCLSLQINSTQNIKRTLPPTMF